MSDEAKVWILTVWAIVAIVVVIGTVWYFKDRDEVNAVRECVKTQPALECRKLFRRISE